jgi:cysteinyl-tRNA synthetase
MLNIYNSASRQIEPFEPVNEETVTIFSCGPSIYQRAHIGNFRTFLYEDIIVRYLEYLDYTVKRGMNITDIEDKAIEEAVKQGRDVSEMTDENIAEFIAEMDLLKIKRPDYIGKASDNVQNAVDIIKQLLEKGIAYWHDGNVYYDPLKFSGFGRLYGLDMENWPEEKRRYHMDTYPTNRWNRGDFILWHGEKSNDKTWDTKIGKGRPSWNVQDPSIVINYFNETLSIFCGGIDNLTRHHDYNIAVLEAVRPYPMAKYWTHGKHLYVNGKKMSKSRGNIYYTSTLMDQGYTPSEIRLFLTYYPYRKRSNYLDSKMKQVSAKLRNLQTKVREIENKVGVQPELPGTYSATLNNLFKEKMNNDLDLKGGFDGIEKMINNLDIAQLNSAQAADLIHGLRQIDTVLQVIF